MRKVYVVVEVRLIVNMDDDVEISKVIEETDYSFESGTDGADIIDTEIRDYKVQDVT